MMGVMHFKNLKNMSMYAKSKGIQSPAFAVTFSGLLLFFGGLGVIIGIYIDIALIFIAIFLLFVTPKMHQFWKETDSNVKMIEMQQFLKNMALLGATLALYVLFSSI